MEINKGALRFVFVYLRDQTVRVGEEIWQTVPLILNNKIISNQ